MRWSRCRIQRLQVHDNIYWCYFSDCLDEYQPFCHCLSGSYGHCACEGSGNEPLDSTVRHKRRRCSIEDDREHDIISVLRENCQNIQAVIRETTQAQMCSSQLDRDMYWKGIEVNKQVQLQTSELDRELKRKQGQDLIDVLGGLVNAVNRLVDTIQNKSSQQLNGPWTFRDIQVGFDLSEISVSTSRIPENFQSIFNHVLAWRFSISCRTCIQRLLVNRAQYHPYWHSLNLREPCLSDFRGIWIDDQAMYILWECHFNLDCTLKHDSPFHGAA